MYQDEVKKNDLVTMTLDSYSHQSSTMKKIESQESFVLEYNALIDKINQSISDLAQYQRSTIGSPTIPLTEKLNRLKIHGKKLEHMLQELEHADDDEWNSQRQRAQQLYEEAQIEWMKASEELKDA